MVAGTFARSIMTFPLDSIFQEPIVTDIPHGSLSSLQVFPNPVEDKLQMQGAVEGQILVFNLSGKIVLQTRWSGKAIDTSSLPSGEYIIHINGQNKTGRFIKK